MILHAVLAESPRDLTGRENVALARRLGRAALEQSARNQGLRMDGVADPFPRDVEQAPVSLPPSVLPPGDPRAWHWSTTNTTALVGGLVAPARVGIDAEWLGRERLGAVRTYLSERELACTGLDERRAALAVWSAKEALLKRTGVGIAGMGRTRLIAAPLDGPWTLELAGTRASVLLLWTAEHVVSVCCDTYEACRVHPTMLELLEEGEAR